MIFGTVDLGKKEARDEELKV